MTQATQTPEMMTTIEISIPGGPDVLQPVTRPVPSPNTGEILIKVAAAGINRPDLLQRLGKYPPPAGASDIPGLEIAGTVVAHGPNCPSDTAPIGTRVCALLSGGGYAEYATAPIGQVLPVPDHLTDIQAAAIPETLFTVYKNIILIGQHLANAHILIHGGASGIGTMAIQMVKYLQSNIDTAGHIIVTCGTDDKCAACLKLGATHAINYKTRDFVDEIQLITGGQGVATILDMVGGDYVTRNLECLAPHGRHITIAMMNGKAATIDLRTVMTRNLTLTGSTLRANSIAEKSAIRTAILSEVWPGVVMGAITPVIHKTFSFRDAAAAHAALEYGDHVGKIVLTMD